MTLLVVLNNVDKSPPVRHPDRKPRCADHFVILLESRGLSPGLEVLEKLLPNPFGTFDLADPSSLSKNLRNLSLWLENTVRVREICRECYSKSTH